MPKREYAATGKLRKHEYEAILRGHPERVSSVNKASIANVRKGVTWKDGWFPNKFNDLAHYKHCKWCGKTFGRRYPSGRLLTPRNFNKKKCCSQSCNLHYLWSCGAFTARPGRGPGRKNLSCKSSPEVSPLSSSSAQQSLPFQETPNKPPSAR